MSKIKIGALAPDVKLPASNGKDVSLKDFRGKNVVLYFYPKDDTPGCTVEACNFRDDVKAIKKCNAEIIGVSPDPIKKHEKFIEKFSLPFLLLADEDKELSTAYGVWVEKSMYGRKYMGVARSTFIIDAKGKIVRIFEKVKPKDHSAEVIEALRSID